MMPQAYLDERERARNRRRILTGLFVLMLVFYLNAQSYVGRLDLWKYQSGQCTREFLGRADSIQASEDNRKFKDAAAQARRKDGNLATAAEYSLLANRDYQRAEAQRARLLGANLDLLSQKDLRGMPTRAARAEAVRICQVQAPKPSPVRLFN